MRIVHGLVLISALGVVGCGGAASDAAVSEDALDTTDVNSSEAALLTSGADVSSSAIAADGIAADVAAGWGAKFSPAGCATSTAQGSTVTLVLNGCTGPFGLVEATGTLAVDIGVSATGYTGHATGTAIKVNRSTIDIDATFTYGVSGGTKMLTVTASGDGTGPRGHHLTRQGSYTVTWGSGCLSLAGTWTTTIDAIKYTTTVTDYSVCEGDCPATGGSVSWTGASRSLSVSFDGSAEATFSLSGPRGDDTGTIALFCTAS